MSEQAASGGISRRNLLQGMGAAALGAALVGTLPGCASSEESTQKTAEDNPSNNEFVPDGYNDYNTIDLTESSPFYGQDHPVGIKDPAQQRHCSFCTFNMADGTTAKDLQQLLAKWTAAAATLQTGKPLGKVRPDFKTDSVPKDTGEAYDLWPASLTFTFGFGASLFDDRFGLKKFKPKKLAEFKRITGDHFSAKNTGSDLCVQVCADDEQVMFHGLRALIRLGRPTIEVGFVQNGFMPMRKEGDQTTPRDLFGFRDGTTNPTEDDEFDKDVWVSDSNQDWFNGGSYMVYRKTYTAMEAWDNDRISDQEKLIGRRKDSGAPLSSPDGDEFTIPDFDAKDADGNYLIDPNSHVAITSDIRLGFKIFRRAYNYWDGLNTHGMQDIGFLNIAYTNDPDKFFRLRDDMGKYDALNEYYYDIDSALYAVPQSPAEGSYIGKEFFA